MEALTSQNVKQVHRLILSSRMQQAIHLLQLPVMELASIVEEELTQNPLLELDEEMTTPSEECELLREFDFSPTFKGHREEEDLRSYLENTVSYEISLFDRLMEQARECFSDPDDLKLAECLVGNLDQDGLLSSPLEEIALLAQTSVAQLTPILREIQTFEPFGVGAQSIQEALLIQLREVKRESSLAFSIVENHFEELIHNKIPAIAKALHRSPSEIREIVLSEIAPLDPHPGGSQTSGHYPSMVHHMTPDMTIYFSENRFVIEINDDKLPPLRMNHSYLKMLDDVSIPEETRNYLKEKLSSSKWLLRNLFERHQTLYRIADELIKTQFDFFSHPGGKLTPLTMKEIAEKLELHESTIARAVANKCIDCPRGLLPLRSFFTNAYETNSGEAISSKTVKELLQEILAAEERRAPFSDEMLSLMIKEKGIVCARRTIAKYRQELGIGNVGQRRIH